MLKNGVTTFVFSQEAKLNIKFIECFIPSTRGFGLVSIPIIRLIVVDKCMIVDIDLWTSSFHLSSLHGSNIE
jgi:hypothetical protein